MKKENFLKMYIKAAPKTIENIEFLDQKYIFPRNFIKQHPLKFRTS